MRKREKLKLRMRTQSQNFYSITSSKLRQVYDFITTSDFYISDSTVTSATAKYFASFYPPAFPPFTIHVLITAKNSMNDEGDFTVDTRETDRYTKSIVASYWFVCKFLKSISLSGQCSLYSDL